MARNTTVSETENGKYLVAWGKDHACGWFIQVFDLEADDKHTPIVDKDALFDGIGAQDVISIASEYNAGDAVQHEMYGL